MSKFIISVENIYKKDYLIPEEDIEAAIKDAMEVAVDHMGNHPYGGLAVVNFYIRPDSDPESKKHRFGSITVDECENRTCPGCTDKENRCCGEMCAACDEDCDNCPFDNIYDMPEPDPDDFEDEEDEVTGADVMDFLCLITDQLERLTALLEKVCKVSPEK